MKTEVDYGLPGAPGRERWGVTAYRAMRKFWKKMVVMVIIINIFTTSELYT